MKTASISVALTIAVGAGLALVHLGIGPYPMPAAGAVVGTLIGYAAFRRVGPAGAVVFGSVLVGAGLHGFSHLRSEREWEAVELVAHLTPDLAAGLVVGAAAMTIVGALHAAAARRAD